MKRSMWGSGFRLMIWFVFAQDDDERTLEEEERIAEEEGNENANEVSVMILMRSEC